jgi:hypothetical protein
MKREEATANVLAKLKEKGIVGELAASIADKLTADLLFESELEKMLHERCSHPLYEYATKESGRSDSEYYPPEGKGWEINVDHYGGYYKHNNYVDNYWRREKKHALTDNVPIFNLPEVRIRKRDFAEVIARLREQYPAAVIHGGTGNSLTSKPEYVSTPTAFFHGSHQPGLLAYSPDTYVLDREWENFPFHPHESDTRSPVYIQLAPEDHPFELLIDGRDPEGNSWVRTKTKGGSWGDWEQIATNTPLPFHPTAWEKLTDMI